ncbi:hypothetical protein BGX28_000430, partial [Mortierella sp. GBA30]
KQVIAGITPDLTAFDRLEWAIPVMQLFHLQMVVCGMLLRTYYGTIATPGSLAFNIANLGRKRLNADMPCYNTADEFLRHTFDAMVRRLWEVELGCESLEKYRELHLATQKPADAHAFLVNKAKSIQDKYFVNSDLLKERFANANVNAALFMRDMLVYMELCDAIKIGDVGRVQESLKILAIMLQAGATKNYAQELLRLNFAINHVWSEGRKKAIFSSWLINTQGKENGFIPADLYQEHNNLLVKNLHAPKGSNMSWDSMKDLYSANIRLFSKVGAKLESQYTIPVNNHYHTTKSAEHDIMRIKVSLIEHEILGSNPRPAHLKVPLVQDLIKEGMKRLQDGRFEAFIQGMAEEHNDGMEEAVVQGLEEEDAWN